MAIILILSSKAIYPFLAINGPIPSKVLIVEGWLPDYAIEDAMNEFRNGQYELLITTGEPPRIGSYLLPYKTLADAAAATLKRLGVEKDSIVAVPVPHTA